MTRSDIILGFIIGAIMGVLLLPVIFILGLSFPYRVALTLVVPFFAIPAGLWLGDMLHKYFGAGIQFSKYVASGLLSFSIDFSILNIISYYTGVHAGLLVGWVNIPGFLLALSNAYFWNKFWVFRKGDGSGVFAHLPRFLFVVLIGMIINSSIVVFMSTNIASPHPAISDQRWLNIAKIVASGVAIVWNFFGYKFIAFKK